LSQGLPRVPGFPILARAWVFYVAIGAALAAILGRLWAIPAIAVGVSVLIGWAEVIHLTEQWALRRTDLDDRLRLLIVIGAFAIPILLVGLSQTH
jgi:putative lipase involved disintegration of autophagic bodies